MTIHINKTVDYDCKGFEIRIVTLEEIANVTIRSKNDIVASCAINGQSLSAGLLKDFCTEVLRAIKECEEKKQ